MVVVPKSPAPRERYSSPDPDMRAPIETAWIFGPSFPASSRASQASISAGEACRRRELFDEWICPAYRRHPIYRYARETFRSLLANDVVEDEWVAELIRDVCTGNQVRNTRYRFCKSAHVTTFPSPLLSS